VHEKVSSETKTNNPEINNLFFIRIILIYYYSKKTANLKLKCTVNP